MEFCHIHMISHVEYFQNINKRLKKINNTFQHKFSILHGSIVDSLLIIMSVHVLQSSDRLLWISY